MAVMRIGGIINCPILGSRGWWTKQRPGAVLCAKGEGETHSLICLISSCVCCYIFLVPVGFCDWLLSTIML